MTLEDWADHTHNYLQEVMVFLRDCTKLSSFPRDLGDHMPARAEQLFHQANEARQAAHELHGQEEPPRGTSPHWNAYLRTRCGCERKLWIETLSQSVLEVPLPRESLSTLSWRRSNPRTSTLTRGASSTEAPDATGCPSTRRCKLPLHL